MPAEDSDSKFQRIRAAFEADGFDMLPLVDPDQSGKSVPYLGRQGFIACAAAHKTSRNAVTKEPKLAYYVEGSNYLMGYFMGLMAEPRIARMTGEYCDNVIFDFFAMESLVRDKSPLVEKLKDLIVEIIYDHSKAMIRDVPYEYVSELKGMLDGCGAIKPSTTVTWDRLWGLNYGIDCLIAHIYTGHLFEDAKIKPAKLRMPIGCNAFGIGGKAAAPGSSFLGRDFMFPTAGVFQDVACIVIHRPEPLEGTPRRAFASQTAPGIIGSVAAMNDLGVGIGIEMCPSSYCDAERPGFNSLGLNRDVVQYSADALEAVERVAKTQRGVSWIYSIADAAGRACILETGRKPDPGEGFPYAAGVPEYYRKRLPGAQELEDLRKKYGYPAPDRGVLPRWKGYAYPTELLAGYNPDLFDAYNRKLLDRIGDKLRGLLGCVLRLVAGNYDGIGAFFADTWETLTRSARWKDCDSGERGFYCRDRADESIPGPYYFAPQRELRDDVVLGTNMFIAPEMRLLSMNGWGALIAGSDLADFQWRYDALNALILEAVDAAPGGIGFDQAWELIDFLDPLRSKKYKDYYNPGGKLDPTTIQVHGSVNLMELAGRSIRSLWGYYGDEAVTIRLARYL
jgi:hypothetical protein